MDELSLIRKVSRRNIIALCVLALLATSSYIVISKMIEQQQYDARVINIAGMQRMLSQKITLRVHQYINAIEKQQDPSFILESLRLASEKITDNQQYLTNTMLANEALFSSQLRAMYFEPPIDLNKRIAQFTEHAELVANIKNSEEIERFIKLNFAPLAVEELLSDLDHAVSIVEQQAQQRVNTATTFETITWFISIIVLIIAYFILFKPIQAIIQRNYIALLRAKNESAEFQFAIDQHAVVYRVDLTGKLTYVNNNFINVYGYDAREASGLDVRTICDKSYTEQEFSDIFNTCRRDNYWHDESINLDSKGRTLWFDTTIVALKDAQEQIIDFIVIQNDIAEQKQTELALSELHRITANTELSFREKIDELLTLGTRLFNLPIGIVSEIEDEQYTVLHCTSPGDELIPGTKFTFADTYCWHTYLANTPKAFHHVGTSEIRHHPCYENFSLESYIGVPIYVEGKRFGTLNFSSPDASAKPFSTRELELIQLIGNWLGAEYTRQRQQKRMLVQQSTMEQMAQQAKIGAWEVDLLNNTLHWSSMTKAIHEVDDNYRPSLKAALQFYKVGESRNSIEKAMQQAISEGGSFSVECQLVTAMGNEIWVAARGTAELENGTCTKVFGSIQDITERIGAAEEIKRYNQRMTLAADSAGIGVWEYNITSEELKWDDWMYKLYDVKRSEFSGNVSSWRERVHPDDLEQANNALAYALENGNRFDVQFRIVLKNKEIRHIKAAAIAVYDDSGAPSSLIGVNYDITERVKNENALKQAKLQAEQGAKAKSEFLASMSHEIRTPMNGIIGMLDLLQDTPLADDQYQRLSIAQESAHSLLTLINDILDFSKIDAGKLELEHIEFNIIDTVSSFVQSMSLQAQQKGLELILDATGVEQCLVMGDPNRIRQILINLVANAIKFTDDGEVILTVTLNDVSVHHWQVFLSVKDSGIGIPKARQGRLFDVFEQLDASTTRQYGGTGLGLAIVKRLCEQMNGNIRVVSEQGEGSEFICELQLSKAKEIKPVKPELEQPLFVLVVDNNRSNGEMICRQFAKWSIEAEFVNNAEQAMLKCNQRIAADKALFDIMLIDIEIPQIDEHHLVELIDADSRFDQIKLVVMTPINMPSSVISLMALNLHKQVTRPITPKTLLSIISSEETVTDGGFESELLQLSDEGTIEEVANKSPILLVEDNRINQAVAKGVLTKLGYKSEVAKHGIEALEMLNNQEIKFGLILMDCQMPEMDGYQTTEAIRSGEAGVDYQKIPIVAMTANAMVGDREKCLAAGMDDYIAKPINQEKVQLVLNRFLT
ncbi:response regulator [Thalassotalea sediminis]|uniref:response regulator n=1 Tax=Thalassotalea sediminis TaxID=1759089 RepID=UPI002573FA25|nr:response regulator [Thalassotalea sediminis]